MSPSQYKESLLNFYEDVVKRSEMPPICIAREEIATPIPHEDDLYYHLDGSNLVMMDVSESYSHKNRPIYVREKKTGKLRYAEWPERSRRLQVRFVPRYLQIWISYSFIIIWIRRSSNIYLQAQYPTKHRSMNIPPSVNPDHRDNSEIIDNFLRYVSKIRQLYFINDVFQRARVERCGAAARDCACDIWRKRRPLLPPTGKDQRKTRCREIFRSSLRHAPRRSIHSLRKELKNSF